MCSCYKTRQVDLGVLTIDVKQNVSVCTRPLSVRGAAFRLSCNSWQQNTSFHVMSKMLECDSVKEYCSVHAMELPVSFYQLPELLALRTCWIALPGTL